MRYQVKRPDPSIPQPPRLLSTKAAAQLLGVSPATLRSWRLRGQGPAWIDLGPSPGDMVRYSPISIADYIYSREIKPRRGSSRRDHAAANPRQ